MQTKTLIVLFSAIASVMAAGIPAEVQDITSLEAAAQDAAIAAGKRCYWDGTAPFCAGGCRPGYREEGRDNCGDGACCVTGSKAYCCKE